MSRPSTLPDQGRVSNLVTAPIRAFLASQGLGTATITPLSQGLSNHNLRLSCAKGEFVLRINNPASSALCQRRYEVDNWRIAAAGGLAPTLLAISQDGGCYLSALLPHGGWHDKYAAVPAGSVGVLDCPASGTCHSHNAALLTTLLLDLARLPVPQNHKGYAGQWHDYRQALDEQGETFVAGINPMPETVCQPDQAVWRSAHRKLALHYGRVDELIGRLEAMEQPLLFSHRDLTPHNLLCHQERLFCIDFEYSCASHPLWDLASVLASHILTADERSRLIFDFLDQHPTLERPDATRVADAISLHWYFGAIWALLMAGKSGDEEYLQWFDKYLQLAQL